jgi:hypothetical protein
VEFDISHHPFISQYLQYVEKQETPRIMHVWAALSGVSAALGRRCWYPYMGEEVWPNMYVILTGPPALRKSTAFRIMMRLLRQSTNVRFAPDDTGGQRQGLIAAMMNLKETGKNDDEEKIIKRMAEVNSANDGNRNTVTLADLQDAMDDLGTLDLDTRDPHTIFVAASELNSILGEGNTALLTFLQKMYDGDPYVYQLKSTSHELKDALLGIIGATTPSQIALAMPPEAIGQGFTSRAVFVFADKKYARKIARPELDKSVENDLKAVYAKAFHELDGPFTEDAAAATHLDALYERGIVIKDPRFVHYADRRHTHLQKLAMVLAASRGENKIRDFDVNVADQLLLYTEESMPDALGEYGMNKLSSAKQRLLDMIKNTDEPIPTQMLYGMMSRDMSQMDFKHIIVELHNVGKLTQTKIKGVDYIIAISDNSARKARREISEIASLMMK